MLSIDMSPAVRHFWFIWKCFFVSTKSLSSRFVPAFGQTHFLATTMFNGGNNGSSRISLMHQPHFLILRSRRFLTIDSPTFNFKNNSFSIFSSSTFSILFLSIDPTALTCLSFFFNWSNSFNLSFLFISWSNSFRLSFLFINWSNSFNVTFNHFDNFYFFVAIPRLHIVIFINYIRTAKRGIVMRYFVANAIFMEPTIRNTNFALNLKCSLHDYWLLSPVFLTFLLHLFTLYWSLNNY